MFYKILKKIMIKGKIFDNTPSGRTLSKRRDAALDTTKAMGHEMSEYIHKELKNENYLLWVCNKCGLTLKMDFISGTEIGGALIHPCRGKSWL
jgi:hypothetical protein